MTFSLSEMPIDLIFQQIYFPEKPGGAPMDTLGCHFNPGRTACAYTPYQSLPCEEH
jgi:hypothetical protein